MNVFFSHSSRDKALVREIKGHCPGWLTPWIDEERLLFGSDLEQSLRNAIDADVDYVVLFLDNEAADSEWVRREIEWALAREEDTGRVILLPVMLADVRGRLHELGLSDRLTLQLTDFTKEGTRSVAEKMVSQIAGWLSDRLRKQHEEKAVPPSSEDALTNLVDVLCRNLKATPKLWREQVEAILLRRFLHQTTLSQRGEIPLTADQYYQFVVREIRQAGGGCQVYAVSTLSSELWSGNLSQLDYARKNIEAAGRGATIRRLFVLPERGEGRFRRMIQTQVEAGISVRVANARLLAHVSELEDLVLFEASGVARGYVAHPSIDGLGRIRSGRLVVAPELTDRMRLAFADGWDLAIDHDDFYRAVAARPQLVQTPGAPGLSLEHRILSRPVVSCEEAAAARGIPVAAELKTLILETSGGMIAAHLPGDGMLSLKKVKDYLEAEEAYLADPEVLLTMGLSAGTVSALLEPVWSMPHLISRRVFDLDEMMTNDGTKTGYFAFDPAILTHVLNIRVGEFEKR